MVVDRPGGAISPTWHVLAAQNPAKVTPRSASAGRPAQGFLMDAYITNLLIILTGGGGGGAETRTRQ